MATYTIKKGLNLPIAGSTSTTDCVQGAAAQQVALLPQEAWGIKVQMLVAVGDQVKVGSPLFCDRRDPDVIFTSPAAGTVAAVNRGARRAVQSVVVDVANFDEHAEMPSSDGSRASLVATLAASGLWPNLRQRPFDKVALSGTTPQAIFVTATDTNPLAVDPLHLVAGREADVQAGLKAMLTLSGGKVYFNTDGANDWSAFLIEGVEQHGFKGPHPAGNAGVHINALHPVNLERNVWHVDVQNLADMGAYLNSGKVPTARKVAVVGPAASKSEIVETQRGASMNVFSSYADSTVRFVSGSLLAGATANPGEEKGFLGRFAQQVSIVDDTPEREFINWMKPIGSRWSMSGTYLAKFVKKSFTTDTDLNGGERAIVPIGSYEKVMPFDIMPTQLIKALASNDVTMAEKLGVLEIVEEDIALCQYVCPSKVDITDMLRTMLTLIEKES
ncbi:MAG: NADH:ubiquinone reductase (Na(+)-transporting) subunit A [Planctomycetes bacterium]|jgi:Na+-transporting NADH:ubiquinone oxidoreductase subunit A|nr:NADH:ubiquinone reductase (Na(+)-transporting) subunit A [Planctomycetota bacterium]